MTTGRTRDENETPGETQGTRRRARRQPPELANQPEDKAVGTENDENAPRYPYIELMLAKRAKTGTVPHIPREPAPACLLAYITARATTGATPRHTSRCTRRTSVDERRDARHETDERDENKDDTNPPACLPAASRLMTPIPFVPIGRDTRQ